MLNATSIQIIGQLLVAVVTVMGGIWVARLNGDKSEKDHTIDDLRGRLADARNDLAESEKAATGFTAERSMLQGRVDALEEQNLRFQSQIIRLYTEKDDLLRQMGRPHDSEGPPLPPS